MSSEEEELRIEEKEKRDEEFLLRGILNITLNYNIIL